MVPSEPCEIYLTAWCLESFKSQDQKSPKLFLMNFPKINLKAGINSLRWTNKNPGRKTTPNLAREASPRSVTFEDERREGGKPSCLSGVSLRPLAKVGKGRTMDMEMCLLFFWLDVFFYLIDLLACYPDKLSGFAKWVHRSISGFIGYRDLVP